MFRIGQRVVCTDDRDPGGRAGLRASRIYQIAKLHAGRYADDGPCLYVEVSALDGLWFSTRFRPLVERPTDISIFTEMLRPTSPTKREKV